jgi:hypothetical protein
VDALLKKLNHKPGTTVTVVGVPPEVEPLVEAWSSETKVKRRLGKQEAFVLAFVPTAAALADVAPKVAGALVDDGVLWLAYPKKSSKRYQSDLSRDDSWQPLGRLGMEPVRQVAVDANWSALRFRRAEHIAQLKRDPSRLLSAEARRRTKRAAAADPPEVAEFLADLPEDRRAILTRVHEVIRTSAPQLEPAVAGKMLNYGPFRYRYATGREGDAYVVSLASQKQYVSLYLCSVVDGAYLAEANADRLGKVSVGKSCVRFKKMEDLDLDVLAELVGTAAENSASAG